jgi:hypothetical protein
MQHVHVEIDFNDSARSVRNIYRLKGTDMSNCIGSLLKNDDNIIVFSPHEHNSYVFFSDIKSYYVPK